MEIKKPHDWGIYNLYVEVDSSCELFIDKNFSSVQGSLIIYGKNNYIHIGKNCMFATNYTIRTEDGHAILDKKTKKPYNKPQNCVIGDNVWLGNNTTVLKGVNLKNDTIVAAGSVVTKSFPTSNIIIASTPAKVIKQDVCWDRARYYDYLETLQ